MSNVKISLMGDLKKQFENELRKAHKVGVEKLVKQIDNRVKDQLRETTNYRLQSGTNEFLGTQPESKIEVHTTPKGAYASYHVYMRDIRTDTPAYVWHLLNGGRDGGRVTSNITFPLRNSARTTPRTTTVQPFPGYSGEWRTMKKGSRINPIRARKWYMVVAQKTRLIVKTAKYKEIEIKKVEWNDF